MEVQEIQEIEYKKRSLRRYRNNVACIDRLEEKLFLLDERITSVKSPSLSGMPRGGKPVSIEELISDKIALEKRIKRLKDKGESLKEEITDEIDTLEDSRYCGVLEAYFIDGRSMEEIAEDMGYSTRWTYDLYAEGIRRLIGS